MTRRVTPTLPKGIEMSTSLGSALLAMVLVSSGNTLLAQDGYQYRDPRIGQSSGCGCCSVGDVATRPRTSTSIQAATGTDTFLRLAQQVRADIRAEMRGSRHYDRLMDDAHAVVALMSRVRRTEALSSSGQTARETDDALTRLKRMYVEVRDDRQALRSQDSVRTLGRDLVAFSRTLDGGTSSRVQSSRGRLSIPTEMKGVALLPPSEQSAALQQRICPVTGGPLGSMGKPIRTTVSGRTVYVCCQGCISTLRNNPQKYLTTLPRPSAGPSHRDSTPQQRPSQASFSIPDTMKGVRLLPISEQQIALRRTCPVMNTPLGSMGKPIKVTVGGRSTYVCCQGCVDSIRQNPSKYLR